MCACKDGTLFEKNCLWQTSLVKCITDMNHSSLIPLYYLPCLAAVSQIRRVDKTMSTSYSFREWYALWPLRAGGEIDKNFYCQKFMVYASVFSPGPFSKAPPCPNSSFP